MKKRTRISKKVSRYFRVEDVQTINEALRNKSEIVRKDGITRKVETDPVGIVRKVLSRVGKGGFDHTRRVAVSLARLRDSEAQDDLEFNVEAIEAAGRKAMGKYGS